MSLATRVLIGLVAGIACGLLFGDILGFLGVVGEAFILLLQMTVIPYIAVSLVTGLGKLTSSAALSLAKRAGGFLLLFWALALGMVVLIPLAYPAWPSASFFSTNLRETGESMDFLSLFIPANPFHSLADAIVPSVVVFSVALGVALIGIERKQTLLDALTTVTEALSSITEFIVRLAPYGVFAIVAHAAGTMDLAVAQGLQVYLAVYAVVALVLSLWTLPALVALLTPFRYRDVVWFTRDALVTAFATGNLFIVLAVLAEKSKSLLRSCEGNTADAENMVDVVVPTLFTFPSAGKLLSLSFLLFAGWFTGFEIAVTQYPAFIASGVASFFGSTLFAVPFLLDLFKIPADMFQLFVIADNITGNRFGAMLAAMHILVLTLLAACAMGGLFQFRAREVARYAVVTVLITAGAIGGLRLTFEAIGSEYLGYELFVEMKPHFEPVETRIVDSPPPEPASGDRSISALDRIRNRGFLRAGYSIDSLPFAFRNKQNELVGFGVDMANLLAREVGVSLELVRVERESIPRLLNAGYLDFSVGGFVVTTERLKRVSFSEPYMDQTLAFVVRDHRRDEFSSRDAVKALESIRLAVFDVPYYIDKIRAYLPQAELIVIESPREFFRDESDQFDALLLTAETGSAWSLVYPQFSVAVPQPDILAVPLAYPVARGDTNMVEFLNAWVNLKKKDGTIDALFAHWILGEATRSRQPRWSVIRNVLGWVS